MVGMKNGKVSSVEATACLSL